MENATETQVASNLRPLVCNKMQAVMSWRDVPPTALSFLLGLQLLHHALGVFPPFLGPPPPQPDPPGPIMSGLPYPQSQRPPLVLRWGPRGRHLQKSRLLRRLGNHFDPEWMSIERPVGPEVTMKRTLDPDLLANLQSLNFSQPADLTEYQGRSEVEEAALTLLRSWLESRGSCGVELEWRDLGLHFWPRHVRHGRCLTENSCSWPPGMHCLPGEHRTIRLLRWHCRPRRQRHFRRQRQRRETESNATEERDKVKDTKRHTKRRPRCKWKKVRYPIVGSCLCSC